MQKEKKAIYPSCSRTNTLSLTYSEVAIENYLCKINDEYVGIEMNNIYTELLKEEEWSDHFLSLNNEFEKKMIITVVFAGMALEAFFNNYAAACLGDDEFYDSFDKLSVINKFELIVKFIIKTDIDKSKAYYYYLKILQKDRNGFVHSKSKAFVPPENTAFTNQIEYEANDSQKIESNFFETLKEELDTAENAIKALKSISLFFEEYDLNYSRLFLSLHTPYDNDEKSLKKKELLKKLDLYEEV